MRMSELSAVTGVSIPTLKYYLREGLLHPGTPQGATRAAYDAGHVERVHLVRTLADVGRLPLERVREVVEALDHPPATRHELLGVAQEALRPAGPSRGTDTATERRVGALGVADCADSPASRQLAGALTAAQAAGWEVTDDQLAEWYAAMRVVAGSDVTPELAGMRPADALRYVIVGTVLTDPVLIALRRVAQESVSAERLRGA